MIIRDRETGTLWQHATGEALIGPLKGQQLTLLGGSVMTWGGWKNKFPATQAALEPKKWRGLFPKAVVSKVIARATSGKVPTGLSKRDRRLPDHEFVIGITISGQARAYPLRLLQKSSTINDHFAGKLICIEHNIAFDRFQVFVDHEPMLHQRTKWHGWYEFHPTTSIFNPDLSALT
jgi:hypothetical protein